MTKDAGKAPPPPRGKLGVWIFGVHGGLATTVMVGARALARRLCSTAGLVTETPLVAGIRFQGLGDLVFGGHDIRRTTVPGSAREIQRETGTIPHPVLEAVGKDLAEVDRNVRTGTALNCGRMILSLAGGAPAGDRRRAGAILDGLVRDIEAFARRHKLSRVVAVNLASTEPLLRLGPAHRRLDALRAAVRRNERAKLRASVLYSLAAAELGLPYIQFTASNGGLLPAAEELLTERKAPYMGYDGKTGETLVKSALSPMFRYRNLRVLSWQGYNMLGDRDGAVLADEANRRAKVSTKDDLLHRILGYPLHTHVGIDFVPSLKDHKTAWDFIHFMGFLDHKMSMQFTWQGCDAILAAPLVLDMVRLADLAARAGEAGPMRHLSCYFKHPVGVEEHDLHVQWHLLTDYLAHMRALHELRGAARGAAHRRVPRS